MSKIQPVGWACTRRDVVHFMDYDKSRMEWRAGFEITDSAGDAEGWALAEAPTAPEAVCIAALIALGHMAP